MTKKEIYRRTIAHFSETMPQAGPELHYGSAFQLLVAVVLSAQCTDRRVNLVTPALFAAYPTAQAMAAATWQDIQPLIASVSYPSSKARHLQAMATQLCQRHGGEVPGTAAELEALTGVGRKTANVILAVIFGQPRMAVDTHVFRVSHRLGLVGPRCRTPLAVERELTRHLPPSLTPLAHHWLILHGRYVCQARRPRCTQCGLSDFCPSAPKA